MFSVYIVMDFSINKIVNSIYTFSHADWVNYLKVFLLTFVKKKHNLLLLHYFLPFLLILFYCTLSTINK